MHSVCMHITGHDQYYIKFNIKEQTNGNNIINVYIKYL